MKAPNRPPPEKMGYKFYSCYYWPEKDCYLARGINLATGIDETLTSYGNYWATESVQLKVLFGKSEAELQLYQLRWLTPEEK